jgi:competence ComEA-like helix-hairpin-helix protein
MKFAFYLFIIFNLSSSAFAVNINTATAEELARELYGIGKVKSQRIIEYREKIGGFRSIEQLTEVYGIGPKTLERNRDKIEIKENAKFPLQSPNSLSVSPKPAHSPSKPPSVLPPPSPSTEAKKSGMGEFEINLSPEIEKTPRQLPNFLWDILIIIPLLIICLLIFIAAWLKKARKDHPMLREHLVNTIFTCSGCGKTSNFQNIFYQGHLSEQNIDSDLPPGWVCIPNWLGKPCDYCFECSQKIHPDNLSIGHR